MRTMILSVLALSIGFTTANPAAQRAAADATESPEVVLKLAMNRELVDGDFAAAVARYRDIAARYRTTAPEVAARATALAEAGAAKLKAQSPASGGLSIQRVTSGSAERVSPDGRFLLRGETNLELYEIATGQVRQVTKDGNETEPDHRYPLDAVFSRDGRRVAYELYLEGDGNRSILKTVTIETAGAADSRTLYDNREIKSIMPRDWSPDGRWIAVSLQRFDRAAQMGLVDASTGSLRILKSTDWQGSTAMSFSLDGRFLAYDLPAGDGEIDRDVFVMALDELREAAVVVNPGDDRLVGWAPEGNRLLFSSDRGGTSGLWAVPFRNGRADGAADFLSDFGIARPIGLTASGALYSQVLLSGAEIWTAPFDPRSRQLTSPPVRSIRRFQGRNTMPFWSPDGRYLAYVSQRNPGYSSPVIVIGSADTGDVVRELRPKLGSLGFPNWSSDGRTMIARGSDLKGRSGIVKIDAATGDAGLVVLNETCSGVPYWAAQGRTFFCYRFDQHEIAEIDVDTAAIKRTFPGVQGAASPDGRYIAYWGDDGRKGGLRLHPLDGGQPRVLLADSADTGAGNLQTLTFTPDSQHVVSAGRVKGVRGVWLFDIAGGEPRRIDVPMDLVSTWRFNPKTWQVAITTTNAPQFEIRRIENFLGNVVSQRGAR